MNKWGGGIVTSDSGFGPGAPLSFSEGGVVSSVPQLFFDSIGTSRTSTQVPGMRIEPGPHFEVLRSSFNCGDFLVRVFCCGPPLEMCNFEQSDAH